MQDNRLVYSTETGRICPECGKPAKTCCCKRNRKRKGLAATVYPDDGTVRIRREVKGRGGKTVTTVSGIPLEGRALKQFAKRLKQRCGTGGTVKDAVIVIQGDHREALAEEIQQQGYRVKTVGG